MICTELKISKNKLRYTCGGGEKHIDLITLYAFSSSGKQRTKIPKCLPLIELYLVILFIKDMMSVSNVQPFND